MDFGHVLYDQTTYVLHCHSYAPLAKVNIEQEPEALEQTHGTL